jgi:molybdate transport system substrate-binding protein
MKQTCRSVTVIAIALFMLIMTACNQEAPPIQKNSTPKKVEISVLAAASLSDVMKEIETKYESSHPNVDLVPSFASSGKLKQQIEQGVPADLFFSASSKEMDALLQKDMIDPNYHSDLLSNDLVLIVPRDSKVKIKGFTDLKAPSIKTISVGQPETVPAGKYAKQALEKMNLWKDVQSKLVFAGDVRQVLTHVKTGNADAGIVYKTDAATTTEVTVVATFDPKSHQPIVYPIGVLKTSKHPKQTQDFYQWLHSPQAMEIFQKYGFKKAS